MIHEVWDIYGRNLISRDMGSLNEAIEYSHQISGLCGAYLEGKDLSGVRLSSASLYGANLSGANLTGADLRLSDLRGADLRGAKLADADLRGCRFAGATLHGADMRGADIRQADFRLADLRDARLEGALSGGADFVGANMLWAKGVDGVQNKYRDGLWAVLDGETDDTVDVLSSIMYIGELRGRREPGVWFVLAETLTAIRGANDAYMAGRESEDDAAEQWFTCINKGDTRENSHAVAAAMEWIEEWHFNRYLAAKAGSR